MNPKPPARAEVPLHELLTSVRQELMALQQLSVDAQLVMGVALHQATLDPAQWRRAQSFDLITQRLQCLSTFTHALTDLVPPTWMMDPTEAVRDVTLSDLAHRLLRTTLQPAETNAIELF